MNLFYLDSDPQLAAQYHADMHLDTALVGACKMLSNAAAAYNLSAPLHINDPKHILSVWVAESYSNWYWTLEYALALCDELAYRFDRGHKLHERCLAIILKQNQNAFFSDKLPYAPTPIPRCMPARYIGMSEDTVQCYRYYYGKGKRHTLKYTKREEPSWLFDAKYY